MLQQWEERRSDREAGTEEKAHAHGHYDLPVDKGISDLGECAAAIREFLNRDISPKAFGAISA
ncbi:MAG: hypothetical protein CME05_08960 [Gemmatimonadaceae bacterium]|nr:hypothetical protein [Gemmatimonadaceae bacterium]